MDDMNDKWNTLTHNGPIFPPEYVAQGYKVYVAGKAVALSPEAEEMAYAWAQKHTTDYIKDKVFQKNFWRDFSAVLPVELKKTKFPEDWDFKEIICSIEHKKELKTLITKAEKEADKKAKDAIKAKYGFALLNGEVVPLGNYMVEPPGLFMGRGDHPLRGSWKCRVFPEDITINHSANVPAPLPPTGHKWKEVVENKKALYIAIWIQKLTGEYKKILFSGDSIVKQSSDQKKFDKAIKLAKNLDSVNTEIDKLLDSKMIQTRKLATVAKLIAQLAIRVGDEKGEDEADTVGASSLRVEHIKINEKEETVEFDFLGKDSVRYNNVVKFSSSMVRNLKWLSEGKKPSDQLFPGTTSADVNEFFGNIIEGITAKVFRTAYGSRLLAEELAKEDVSTMTPAQKLKYFTDANLAVAKKLNHQSAISPAYKESVSKMKEQLKELKAELKEVKENSKSEIEEAKKIRDDLITKAKDKYTGEKQKETIRRAKSSFDNKVEAVEKKIARVQTRIDNLESKLEIKQKTAGIALGTSKTNYSDPRIAYSYCKANNLEVKRIFTPTLQRKFVWAENVDENFYKKYPEV